MCNTFVTFCQVRNKVYTQEDRVLPSLAGLFAYRIHNDVIFFADDCNFFIASVSKWVFYY